MVLEDWQEPPVTSPRHGVTGLPIGSLPPSNRDLGLRNGTVSKKSRKSTNISSGFTSTAVSGTVTPEESRFSDDSTISHSSPIPPPPPPSVREQTCELPPINEKENKFKIRLKTELFDSLVTPSNIRRSSRVSSQETINYYVKAKEDLGLVIKKTTRQNGGSQTPPPLPPPHTQTQIETEIQPQTPTKRNGTYGTPPNARKTKKVKITLSPQKVRENPFGFADLRKDDISGKPRQAVIQGQQQQQQQRSSSNEIANNDYCSACGGLGKFLCCETCPRSFHFTCVDPPLEEETLPDGEWYCNECYTRRNPPTPYRNSLFSKLINQLERRNPRQFRLPKKIIEHFEGVTINQLGEYEDETPKVNKPKSAIKDDNDPLTLLDKNGKPKLCYRCKKSALNGRMITCDICPLNWHIDCLEAPTWTISSRWKCPNHADQAVKLPRKQRKYKLVDTVLNRGFKNDGNIEVVDSSDDEEGFVQDIPFFDNYDTRNGIAARYPKGEKTFFSNGVLYRLPARGIKLDFIEAVNNSYIEPYPESIRSEILIALDELASRTPETRQAVRDLCYLQSEGDSSVNVAIAKENLNSLVSAALEDDHPTSSDDDYGVVKQEKLYPSPTRSIDGSTGNSLTGSLIDSEKDTSFVDEVLDSEREQLLIIKRLMKIKGREKVLKFLLESD